MYLLDSRSLIYYETSEHHIVAGGYLALNRFQSGFWKLSIIETRKLFSSGKDDFKLSKLITNIEEHYKTENWSENSSGYEQKPLRVK